MTFGEGSGRGMGRYNVAPTQEVLIVSSDPEMDQGRRAKLARWGLVPGWAKDLSAGYRMINARAEGLLEASQNLFGDPHSVGSFVVPADRGDLSVRQKDWFDNAVPAGNSSLLHGFSQIQMLSTDTRWAREFNELSTAYGGLCKNVPNGVAHALDGIARFAIGHATVKSAGRWNDLRCALNGDEKTAPHARPFRPLFLIEEPSEAGFAVCVGQTCLASVKTAQEAAASL